MIKRDPKKKIRDLRQIRDTKKLFQIENTTLSNIEMTSGQLFFVDSEVSVPFQLGSQWFKEKFLVLNSANSLIHGNTFFRQHSIQICPKHNLQHFPDMTIQVSSIKEMEQGTTKNEKIDKNPSSTFKRVHL